MDARYPQSAVLGFLEKSESRFWEVPLEPEWRPLFIASLMKLMGDWQTCCIWRHLGGWPDPARVDASEISNVVELRILRGLGVPLGSNDVLEFGRDEFDSLVTLVFSTTVFGFSVADDLYIVPDHARYIMQTDHHHVIHVSFRDPSDVQTWISEMADVGFELPEDLPDPTFKRPSWMPPTPPAERELPSA